MANRSLRPAATAHPHFGTGYEAEKESSGLSRGKGQEGVKKLVGATD